MVRVPRSWAMVAERVVVIVLSVGAGLSAVAAIFLPIFPLFFLSYLLSFLLPFYPPPFLSNKIWA